MKQLDVLTKFVERERGVGHDVELGSLVGAARQSVSAARETRRGGAAAGVAGACAPAGTEALRSHYREESDYSRSAARTRRTNYGHQHGHFPVRNSSFHVVAPPYNTPPPTPDMILRRVSAEQRTTPISPLRATRHNALRIKEASYLQQTIKDLVEDVDKVCALLGTRSLEAQQRFARWQQETGVCEEEGLCGEDESPLGLLLGGTTTGVESTSWVSSKDSDHYGAMADGATGRSSRRASRNHHGPEFAQRIGRR